MKRQAVTVTMDVDLNSTQATKVQRGGLSLQSAHVGFFYPMFRTWMKREDLGGYR